MRKIQNHLRTGFLASMSVIAFLLLLAPTARAQSADETAIKKVCEAETRAWLDKDLANFNNCWQVRPYSRAVVTTEEGVTINIVAAQMQSLQAEAMGGEGTFANSNYLIHVDGNMAWATYDEVKTDSKGQHPSYEFRMLEKVDGSWKIVAMSVHHYKAK
jgi:hypothetical protein